MNIDDILDSSSTSNNELVITGEIGSFLKETAKWAKFLAITGFVMMGLTILFTLFSNFMLMASSSIGGGMIFFSYLPVFVIYFFPLFYMYRFALNMEKALAQNDHTYLRDSFKKLKSLFKFSGILMIILLASLLLGIIVGILFLGF